MDYVKPNRNALCLRKNKVTKSAHIRRIRVFLRPIPVANLRQSAYYHGHISDKEAIWKASDLLV